ncbi:hypothetical protein [Phytohabitans houttuyneae]|uniref:Uncharacterized protein n=1 Tax=Phytohabitans houttuyneae TaxID=1076126 RepID=A0A6V8K2R0_9ACTN|nr:hypothetical protein [Phytohabitans houttuyneae]GFJ76459.1 hypothetical protein Phou_006390 [Phytohabitans houttuyneae]
MTTDQSSGRREFYAAVALTDLPMPERVTFEPGHVRLVFDTLAAGSDWAHAYGVDLTNWRDDDAVKSCGYGIFAGWRICLLARGPLPVAEPPVADATRAELEALTREVA